MCVCVFVCVCVCMCGSEDTHEFSLRYSILVATWMTILVCKFNHANRQIPLYTVDRVRQSFIE